MRVKDYIDKLLNNTYDINDIIYLLSITDEKEKEYLFNASEEICENYFGKKVYVRGIIEFSNYCRKNCKYCGIRRDNNKLSRYRISPEDIINLAINGYYDGFHTIVLQSGEDIYYDDKMEYIIRKIKNKVDIAITLSIGERDFEYYKKLREAGADRFLLRIETTDESLFKKLHPDDNFSFRLRCLKKLKEYGYEVGTGVMIGLPGQSIESLAKDIIFFKNFDADMVGVGPFIPHPDTPLADEKAGTLDMTLKVIAISRILLKDTNVPATTAMGTIDKIGREKALKAGANVIMPNYTPAKYRPLYKLYDNKICIFESAENCMECVKYIAKRAGKYIVREKGSRLKKDLEKV